MPSLPDSIPADSIPTGRPFFTSDTSTRPVLLSWTDPEDGQVLCVELWASPELVDGLMAQGFELRSAEDDETASSLCARIRHSTPASATDAPRPLDGGSLPRPFDSGSPPRPIDGSSLPRPIDGSSLPLSG
jgi:hypothetical protein